ncbi:MAG: H-NS histone family protein [Rhizobiales bacterium]|nr:H-NS histone family protein [Hyphomicrobiales bacterium]
MRVNLAEMSLAELLVHRDAIDQAIVARRSADREIARRAVADRARELGFSVEELFGEGEGTGEARGAVAPKYADPRDPARTWSGRGRTPRWVSELEAEGVERDALLIQRD